MEEKKTIKISLTGFIVIIAIIIVVIGVISYFAYKFYNEKMVETNKVNDLDQQINVLNEKIENYEEKMNTISNVVSNKENTSNTVPSAEDKNENTNSSKDIKKIEIDDKEKFKALYYVEDFNRIDELKAKDMINVAGIAIYKKFINVNGTDTNEGIVYTVEDVKSVVYSIFGIIINENVSADSIIYKNGKYILNPADGDTVPSEVRNINSDVAAGTVYYSYDLYGVNASIDDDEYENMGSYEVSISNGVIISKKVKNTKN